MGGPAKAAPVQVQTVRPAAESRQTINEIEPRVERFAGSTWRATGGSPAAPPGDPNPSGVDASLPILHSLQQIPVRVASPPRLQARLDVSAPSDPAEREAEAVAQRVVESGPAVGGDVSKPLPKLTAGPRLGGLPGPVRHALDGPSQPLAPPVRHALEPRFGYDLGGVRVHTGRAAAESARSLGAQAYTLGHRIVFGAGRFAPQRSEGRRLLAHELTHVVQQRGGPSTNAAPQIQRQDDTLEDRRLRPRTFTVSSDYDTFRHEVEAWLALQVQSRTLVERDGRRVPSHRERELVAASNLESIHRNLVSFNYLGESVRLQATLIAGAHRYERVEFTTPGIIFVPMQEIEGEPTEPPPPPPPARAQMTYDYLYDSWLRLLLEGRGFRRDPNAPRFDRIKFLFARYFETDVVLDVQHFFVVGSLGEEAGNLNEFRQQFSGNPGQQASAMDPQDFYSNLMGVEFYQRYYDPNGVLSDQLRQFFDDVLNDRLTSRRPSRDRPSAGVPPAEIPAWMHEGEGLNRHRDEARHPRHLIAYVRRLERWLRDHPFDGPGRNSRLIRSLSTGSQRSNESNPR